MSTREMRTRIIENLEQEINGAAGIYITDFDGIDVEKITKFRSEIRNAGAKYIVVKNKLAKVVFERCQLENLSQYLKGQTGIAVTKGDAVGPAKVIKEFKKENGDLLKLKASYVEGTVFNSEETIKLADIPSREVLLSQLLSCFNSPMSKFVGSLSGILTKAVGVLNALKEKKESESN